MSSVIYFTEEGFKKIKEELEHLKLIERPAITNMIAEARDKGDLSENAEYDAAKEAQAMLELKISKLEDKIANSRIIDESKLDATKVQILTRVKIRNTKTKAEFVYMLVPELEANFKEGKISVNTPIAQGIMGKKPGDKVEVVVPNGKIEFEIIEILK
ncbi:MAG: transcription elongation factor GreA [Bacteroidetes bacterium HGW-Bacteroidetes-21]|nr:MAG: transcription elongation factor GreA [Bacteroidetes bacterium HGW-Bacteroidetes-21]